MGKEERGSGILLNPRNPRFFPARMLLQIAAMSFSATYNEEG